MNLQQLEYFQEIARTQNMTQSAKRLHVSQPALSSTLKALENELGVALFDRKGRSLVLNQNGEEFLKNANSIFDILHRSQQNAVFSPNEPWEEIVIGAMGTETPVLPHIARFAKDHPQVSFKILSRQIISKQNPNDTADFLISSTIADHEGRQIATLPSSQYLAILPRDHPLASREEVELTDLADTPFVFCSPPEVARPRAYILCVQAGFNPRVILTADARLTVFGMLLQGGCTSLVSEIDADFYLSMSDKIICRPLRPASYLPPRFHSYISWQEERLSPIAQQFLLFLLDKINTQTFD